MENFAFIVVVIVVVIGVSGFIGTLSTLKRVGFSKIKRLIAALFVLILVSGGSFLYAKKAPIANQITLQIEYPSGTVISQNVTLVEESDLFFIVEMGTDNKTVEISKKIVSGINRDKKTIRISAINF